MSTAVEDARSMQTDACTQPRALVRTPRVLQVVLSLTPGGTEHLVVEMCRRLAPEFGVAVCCLDDEGEWAVDLKARGIDVKALHRRPGFRPQVGREIARFAAERQFDVLHCHQYSPFVYGRLAAFWNRRLKIVYTEHGRLSDAPPSWKRRLVNPLLSRFDGSIVAVSHELRDYMIEARFPERVDVVHNGVEPAALPSANDRRRARQMLRLDERAFVVATVARLDSVKDLTTLLDAFAIVRRRVASAQLVIVGDGPERNRLAARAAQADLRGAVHLTGFRSDVRAVLPAADVYASSSISEGISITILEAMAAGIPVVATAVGGTPEVLPDESAGGLLVPCRDPDRMASAIVLLALDRQKRAAIAAAGRRRLERAFTIDRMVEDYAHIYRSLVV